MNSGMILRMLYFTMIPKHCHAISFIEDLKTNFTTMKFLYVLKILDNVGKKLETINNLYLQENILPILGLFLLSMVILHYHAFN